MKNFEKLGLFYLGKMVDPSTHELKNDLMLYESKDLTTHAICVGMTGSGKTGLGITLIEEAAIDKIPAIIIDPKGDLGNLLLNFPHLSPEEFQPWVDKAEAEKKGMDSHAFAEKLAKSWEKGLAAWGENAERIKTLKDSVDMVIYTPASHAGVPLSILSSLKAPSKEQMKDSQAVRDKIISITTSLLGLIGIEADPIKSREYTLISLIIQQAWESGKDLDISILIQQVQKPPFTKVGALDIETFYPQKERKTLSILLNNLLASPGFQAWMEGEPLDISRLLYTDKGKPKLSILSIAHLSDAERMFFVTLLLNEVIFWMRQQPGISSLRALLYMDEIFGFFPPTAMPPSKLPMLTLLKQARAFGVGIVLSTQNPVDLDYKGLSNCGTWFIGKLQTARDKMRVIEGLQNAAIGGAEANQLNKMLSSIGNRMFVMRNVHEKDLVLFQTRWTLSYLYGPLTLTQIANLTDKSQGTTQEIPLKVKKKSASLNLRPHTPIDVKEFFAHPKNSQQPVHYKPHLIGIAKLHFVNSKNNIDFWRDICMVLDVEEGKEIQWEKGENLPQLKPLLQTEPIPNSTFEDLPPQLLQEKNYPIFAKKLAESLYQNQTFLIYQTSFPKLISKPDELEKDFRIRVALEMRGKRDERIKKLREKYAGKVESLTKKIRQAYAKLTEKQQKAQVQKTETMISIGSTILGTLFGRKITKGTVSQTGSTLRRRARMGKDSKDADLLQEEIHSYQQELQDVENQLNNEISSLEINENAETIQIETTTIRPRKSDIDVNTVAVLWVYNS
jgi:Helicase HerA, central domain